ncbi:MAG: peptidoglycan-associated lipoprotein Pal [Alphaproteobacteria bacterium]|nr:peptidoglycan-associated lipoprotein Pal [Alphaproteobacteria bacterium]
MLARTLMIFSALLIVSACSSTDDQTSMDAQGSMASDSTMTADGPLADIYAQDVNGATPGTQADLTANIGDRVFFGYDRYDLTPEARTLLEGQANWLNQYSNLNVTIEGHADERGTREYNLALSERRANSVKNYLIALGVDPRRLNTIGYGKERPAVVGASEGSWAQNRRAVTTVQ